MSGKAAGAAAGEEAAIMRQLELLLVPLHHRFRYPLPLPAHLAASREQDAVSSASPLLNASTSNIFATAAASPDGAVPPSSTTAPELLEEQQFDRLRHAALQVVEEQVPDLLPWQTRVQQGAVQAESCYQVLEHVRGNIAAMQRVTESVQEQSDHLSHNASAMMVRKAKLELVRDALEQNLAHFTHIDDLCREAGNPFLKAGTARFSTLLQDIAKEMEFLSTNTQYKSAKPYAMRLAVAQQMVSATLKDAVRVSFNAMEKQTLTSPAFRAATHVLQTDQVPPPDVSAAAVTAAQTPLGGAGAAPSPAASLSVLESVSPLQKSLSSLELRADDVAGSFEDYLTAVNDAFVRSGESYTSLRRMAELRQGGFGYSGAEAFGEEMLTATGGIEADPGMKEVLDAYRDARVAVVVPLLRYWLTLWYYLDAERLRLSANTTTAAEQAAQPVAGGGSGADARRQLNGVAEAHTLPQLAEHICWLLQRSLFAESEVLNRLWLREDIAAYLLPKLVSSIAEEVYYAFRSRLLCVDDVSELAQTVESVQRVSLRQGTSVPDTEVVSDLWMRMIQDTQERLVFRTSVYLRQTVARSTPTREVAAVYLRCGTGAYTAAAAASSATGGSGGAAQEAETKMFYLPGVLHALQLLHWLYPTLEFSVFSVFAEEAVHHSLDLVRQLGKLMRQIDTSDVLRDTKAQLCQLAHLQYLEKELSRVDANITVVERHLSFEGLRKSRLELEQSSRESKKEVQVDLLKCTEQLTTAMLSFVTQPMSGAAKKSEAERTQAVAEMKGRAAGVQRMIAFYVEHGETRQDLAQILRERTAALAAEVSVDIHAVPAAAATLAPSSAPRPPAPAPPATAVAAPATATAATPASAGAPPPAAPVGSPPRVDSASAAPSYAAAMAASMPVPPPAPGAPTHFDATAAAASASSSNALPPPPSENNSHVGLSSQLTSLSPPRVSEAAPAPQTLPPPPTAAAPPTEAQQWRQQHPPPSHAAAAGDSADTDLI